MTSATKKPLANGNGAGTGSGHYLGLINSGAIALLIAMFTGFWSLADPRGELKNIRDSYLSIREHNEFASRVQLESSRLDKVNSQQYLELLTLREWSAWKLEHDASIVVTQKRVEGMVTRNELDMLVAKQQVVIDSLRREIDQIDKSINARIGPPATIIAPIQGSSK